MKKREVKLQLKFEDKLKKAGATRSLAKRQSESDEEEYKQSGQPEAEDSWEEPVLSAEKEPSKKLGKLEKRSRAAR